MDKTPTTTPPFPRAAGILMHITSLPSAFGTGDLGPEAHRFADFLQRSHQTYWQLLPLNPTTDSQGYSPYSAYSSMAGNPLLISPELLQQQGLLDKKDLVSIPFSTRLNHNAAFKAKRKMLDASYQQYSKNRPAAMLEALQVFNEKESYWLTDFALFSVLRAHHGHQPWYEWPDAYRSRDAESLQTFAAQHQQEIEQCKWEQMVFHVQWHDLKEHCGRLGIRLFGDLPFYVGQDSADVWAHRDIFAITSNGQLTGVAGVPPDAFSETGQRWGMPVFKWDVLKERGYDWWITRLQKNMEFFDLLRLDHFRAFASYWEVPPDEDTAINGEWKKGPGADFFEAVQRQLGELPFIAEDLGKIDADVLQLRDTLNLPGMNVLHFAFGKNMPYSDYITHHNRPHSVTYTGTHDNNTTKGWFKELSAEESANLSAYLDARVTTTNVCRKLNRLAYSSVSDTTILPLQDVLELDEKSRMNAPGSSEQNWSWRLDQRLLTQEIEDALSQWCTTFDRSPRLKKIFEENNREEE